jgi:CMP-N-acetylneuraminic acid synthetase
MFQIRSQDLKKKYFDTGTFIFFPRDVIVNSLGAGDDHSYIGFELDKAKAIDIDDQDDWEFAELVMKALVNTK